MEYLEVRKIIDEMEKDGWTINNADVHFLKRYTEYVLSKSSIMENCLCRPGDGRHYVYDPKCPVHPPEEELKKQIPKMHRPKRSDNKYWTGTRNFNHIQYENDLEDYISDLEVENGCK